MYTKQSKKMLIIDILTILKRYTDQNHRVSQKEIAEILKTEYGMIADRKAIKRNLMELVEFGYPIRYRESLRMTPNKNGELEENYILSDFYLERDFSDAELRLLIDGLLFSRQIPHDQCQELIQKLEGLSNKYFRSKVKHICMLPSNRNANTQLFDTINALDDAISNEKQVMFQYAYYGTDKRWHPQLDKNGQPRQYIINPYQMVATKGRYYLVCNNDKFDTLANYRVDRITNIQILKTPSKPIRDIPELKYGFDLNKHMAEHIYMFAGQSTRVKFVANKTILNDIYDYFGDDVVFSDETDNEVTATVMVNEQDMRLWAMQFALQARVISPQKLANDIKDDLCRAAKQYADHM